MDVLKNKQYRSYTRLSRYNSFPYYYNTLDKKYVTQIPTALDTETPFSVYQVKGGESYDQIALEFYNNPTYYWIICDVNNVLDPLVNPYPGTYLKIPQLSNIQFMNY